MSRIVCLDAGVIIEIHAGNQAVAIALRRMIKSGAKVYVSLRVYDELTGGRTGVLKGGIGKKAGGIGPDLAETARAQKLFLDDLRIKTAPEATTRQQRMEFYDKAADIQDKDVVMAAEAKALGAELWTMEGEDRLKGKARRAGVTIAVESDLPKLAKGQGKFDYNKAREWFGLKPVQIAANGSVTKGKKKPRGPASGGSGPALPPKGAPPSPLEPSARGQAKIDGIELALQGVNFIVHAINDHQEERKFRAAWKLESPKIQAALKANTSWGALILISYTRRKKIRQEHDAVGEFLNEFRDIEWGCAPTRKEALQKAIAQAKMYKNPHGKGVDVEPLAEQIWIPPDKPVINNETTPPFSAYAVATFAPGRSRLQKVFWSALGFDDDGDIEIKVPSGSTPEFFLLQVPKNLEWLDEGGRRSHENEIAWIEPTNPSDAHAGKIQVMDLDPVIGWGDTKAAMVYPANAETKRLFARSGLTNDKTGELRRINADFLLVHWVCPQNLTILRDLRNAGRSSTQRDSVSSARESPRAVTPLIDDFSMVTPERPMIFRD